MATEGTLERIRRLVLDTLSQTPPELAADIVDRGMLLCEAPASSGGSTPFSERTPGWPC